MVLSFRTILSVCGAALIAARPALAYDPYLDPYAQNSARQNREWQARNEHYDAIAAMNSARGPLNAVAPVEWKSNAQRQREWNETLARIQAEADAKAAGDRAWEAHLAAYSAKINAQNAEIDRINEDIRRRNALNEQKSYEDFVAKNDGMGTKRMPPPFASQDQAFRWHLQQAQNGDVYGAFFVGRALMAGNGATKNHNHALLWLEKSNPAWPLTNTLLGALLVNGEGIQPDPQRGRELLKKGAANDQDGVGAWIYGNILRSGAGLPADVDLAAQQLRMAVVWTEKDDPYDGVSPRLEWWPSVGEWDARAFRIRQDFAALVAEHPERVAAWAQEWTSEKVGSVSYNSDLPLLQKSFSAALPKMSREARLRCLDEIEQRDAPALGFFRQEVLAALLGAKQDEARALLPWQPRRGADSYFSRLENPDQAKRLWTESGAQVETWAQGENALAAAARRALLARDMGFWPSVAPVQPPAVALAHLKAQKDAPDLLEREIRRAAAQGRVPWNDASATQKWLDGAIANDVRFQTTKQSIATWQQVAGTEKRAREFDERLNTARVALEKR